MAHGDHPTCTLCGKCLICQPHPPHTAGRDRGTGENPYPSRDDEKRGNGRRGR